MCVCVCGGGWGGWVGVCVGGVGGGGGWVCVFVGVCVGGGVCTEDAIKKLPFRIHTTTVKRSPLYRDSIVE